MERRGGGFTLLELLVVISIIALLVAILLPALRAAREAGRSVNCQSNLRQQAIALETYAMDEKGVFPPTWVAGGWAWSQPGWHQLLRSANYIPNYGVLTCPTALDLFVERPPTDPNNYYFKLMHYGINYFFITGYPGNASGFITDPARTSEVEQPSQTILTVDAFRWSDVTQRSGTWRVRPYYSTGLESEQPDPRHNDSCNTLWMDSHVRAVAGSYEPGAGGIYSAGALTTYVDSFTYWDREAGSNTDDLR